ncbi:hypothetical protein PhCBS80983_g01260 [Powellomyces hirtus]|uniref:DUF747-domain-containing protein n=1 Tax=Powellomyces hirtus TaxID=109895 RepID=A0A507ED87_9FUNG|nr:hypothetical protein PhCBS80983_g01260 [Powellomyces hirtus]
MPSRPKHRAPGGHTSNSDPPTPEELSTEKSGERAKADSGENQPQGLQPRTGPTTPANRRRHTGVVLTTLLRKTQEDAVASSNNSSTIPSPVSPPAVRKRRKTGGSPRTEGEAEDRDDQDSSPLVRRAIRSLSITDFRRESLENAFAARAVVNGDSADSSFTSLASSTVSDMKSTCDIEALPFVHVGLIAEWNGNINSNNKSPSDEQTAESHHGKQESLDGTPLASLRASRILEPSDVITWNAVQHDPDAQSQFDSPAGSMLSLADMAAGTTDMRGAQQQQLQQLPLPQQQQQQRPVGPLDRRQTVPSVNASATPPPPRPSTPAPITTLAPTTGADPVGSVWDYFRGELFGSDFDESPDVKKERIQNFLSVPFELEKLMFFGCMICFDSFLHIFTILPLRLLIAAATLLKSFFSARTHLTSSQKCDLMKGALIVICCYMLQRYDASRIYHSVRGQALIKLYVIFNSLEICDKLCSAFGHDILDSLFSKATVSYTLQTPQHAHRTLGRVKHFLVALCYVFTHSIVLFYQVMTLNVAVNSYNNALLTLLMSNQFVEIKGSVFKRFEKENLFQLSCADIVERFQLMVFLCIITLRNLIELTGGLSNLDSAIAYFYALSASVFAPSSFITSFFSPTTTSTTPPAATDPSTWFSFVVFSNLPTASTLRAAVHVLLATPTYKLFETLATPVIVVFGTEVLVDWLKHAFISKFNQIKPAMYGRFTDSLCRDLVAGRVSHVQNATAQTQQQKRHVPPFIDQSPAVARRIGFVSIPLSCLVVRVTVQTMQMLVYLRTPTQQDTNTTATATQPGALPLYEQLAKMLNACVDAWGTTRIGFAEAEREEMVTAVKRVASVVWTDWPAAGVRDAAVEVVAWMTVVVAVYLGLLALKLAVGMSMHRAARQRCNDLDTAAAEAHVLQQVQQQQQQHGPPSTTQPQHQPSLQNHPPARKPDSAVGAGAPPSSSSASQSQWASRRPSASSMLGETQHERVQQQVKNDKLDTVDRFTMVKSRIV